MMIPLTFDLKSSAELLNVKPRILKKTLERKEIEWIKIGGEYRLSIFILSKLLETTHLIRIYRRFFIGSENTRSRRR